MVLISLQARETVRSRAFFLFSFVFSQGVLLQLADIALGPATPAHHPRGGFLPFLVVRSQQSRVTRTHREVHLLQVDVLRARWMWTRTSVYRHYSGER